MAPHQRAVMQVLAYTLLQNERPAQAASLLEALDLLDPDRADTLRTLALAQLRGGKPAKALRTLDRLAMAGGNDEVFHLLRAQALVAAKRPLEASAAIRHFVQLREPSGAAHGKPH